MLREANMFNAREEDVSTNSYGPPMGKKRNMEQKFEAPTNIVDATLIPPISHLLSPSPSTYNMFPPYLMAGNNGTGVTFPFDPFLMHHGISYGTIPNGIVHNRGEDNLSATALPSESTKIEKLESSPEVGVPIRVHLTAEPTSNISAAISTQPANYQIVNYNVNPAPCLALNAPFASNETITAYLVESTSQLVVGNGFQSGDVRVLRSGTTTIRFSGLKLNKMAAVKASMSGSLPNVKVLDTTFRIRFTVNNFCFYTDPFKIVSSCSQLPSTIRYEVRPIKRERAKDEE